MWPSMPRKLTCDRSGSLRLASPPAVSGAPWAIAAAALANTNADSAARTFAPRRANENVFARNSLIPANWLEAPRWSSSALKIDPAPTVTNLTRPAIDMRPPRRKSVGIRLGVMHFESEDNYIAGRPTAVKNTTFLEVLEFGYCMEDTTI